MPSRLVTTRRVLGACLLRLGVIYMSVCADSARIPLLDRLAVEGVAGGEGAVLEADGEPVDARGGRTVGPVLGVDRVAGLLLDRVVAHGLGGRDRLLDV